MTSETAYDGEIWKKIDEFEKYSVSNYGRVRKDKSGKILNQKIRGKYCYIGLHKDGKQFNRMVHRLVGLAFLENTDNKPEIDHKDKNKMNNHVSNLRFASHGENMRNRNKLANCSSIYKGVCLHSKYPKYVAYIKINNKYNYLGFFEDEKEAGLAYNKYIIDNGLEEFFILNEIN